MDTYMSTAICAERTEVLVLEMKHFERLFVKRHQRTIDKMRRNLETKLHSRSSILKDRDEIVLLRLIQLKLHMIHHPQPTNNEKKKKETSVQSAEKMFFSHQGPLLDMDGPGSVFYMIRAREKSKLKRSMLQKEKTKVRPVQGFQNGHLHAIRLPQNLVMAAQIAGASELRVEESKPSENNTVETLPENNPVTQNFDGNSNTNAKTSIRVASAVSHRTSREIQHSEPKSVRRIKSAAKHKLQRNNNKENTEDDDDRKNDFLFKSLPSPRPVTMLENFKVDDNLRRLEAKVEEWLKKANPKAGTNVSKLRRLHVEVSSQTV